jgi:hypothetical protein
MVTEVLEIIRAREKKLIALRLETFKKGVDYATTIQKKIDGERELVGLHLLSLLGPDRYEKFSEMDSNLNSSARRIRWTPFFGQGNAKLS